MPGPVSRSRHAALGLALIYAAVAALWIVLSDQALEALFSDPALRTLANTGKGLLFVLVTSLLLYAVLRRGAATEPPDARDGRLRLPAALLVLGIVALTAVSFRQVFRDNREAEIARLHAIAELKVQQIADWLDERAADAEFVHSSELYAAQFRLWQEQRDAARLAHLKSRLYRFVGKRGFSTIRLLDADGRPLWTTSTAADAVPQAIADLRETTARGRTVRRAGPYLTAEGHVRLEFLVPLAVTDGTAPLVVLQVDAAQWLYPTLQRWPVPSASGEALLFRRDGDQVLFLSELRQRPDSALRLRLPVAHEALLAARMLRGETRSGEVVSGRDYRDVAAAGVVRAVPGSDWFLIAKMDAAELNDAALAEALWIAPIGLLALLLALAGLVVLRQRHRIELAERLRRTQDERLQALNLLGAVADASDDAIFAKDLDGRYVLFNRAAGAIVGKTAGEVIGRDDHALFPPDQAEMLMDFGRRVAAEGRTWTEEEVLDTAAGQRVFLATKGPLRDAAGRVYGIFGISRDITGRKEAERRLAEETARFRFLLDHSIDGIAIFEQDHRISEANQRLADMLGYAREELIGLYSWDIDAALDEAEIRAGFADLSAVNRVFETRHRRKDGSEYDVEISASGMEWAGHPLVMTVARDITARKAAEEQLNRQAEELRQRNEELERFNRSMVGRELDMIELKRQVNALCRELGRAEPFPLAFLDAPARAADSGDAP